MALGGLLERMKHLEEDYDYPIVKKSIRNGNLLVANVPHAKYPNGLGPDGKSEYLPSDVVYKLSLIFSYMLKEEKTDFDFEKFDL